VTACRLARGGGRFGGRVAMMMVRRMPGRGLRFFVVIDGDFWHLALS
jgi:hypothetical protein